MYLMYIDRGFTFNVNNNGKKHFEIINAGLIWILSTDKMRLLSN